MQTNIVELKNNIESLARKYNLELVILFGSQASKKTHKQSDLDIAVLAENDLSGEDEWRVANEISLISGIKDVEIVNLKTASPILLKEITDNGINLYEKDSGLFSTQRMRAFKMFVESKPLRILRDQKLLEFLSLREV